MIPTTYEGHITVCDHPTERKISVFREFAKSKQLKPLHLSMGMKIGDFPEQLMAGVKLKSMTVAEAAIQVGVIAGKLESAGYATQRIKLESPMDGENIDPKYFECHCKIQPPVDGTIKEQSEMMTYFLAHYHAGFSINQFNSDWFLTQRCHNSESMAIDQFDYFYEAVSKYFKIIKAHSECVLVDTNPDLDKGWIV